MCVKMSKKVYVFTATSFHDDYKLRGNSPSTTEVLAVFSTKERACAYQEYWLEDYVRTTYKDNWYEEDPSYDAYKKEDGSLKHNLDSDDLQELAEKFSEGDYVPYKMEWGIQDITVDLLSTPVLEHIKPEEEEESPLKKTKTM